MTEFDLEILTPEKPFFTGKCVSLAFPAPDGMMGVMANHSPMNAAVCDGRIVYTLPEGGVHVCAVTRGMISVNGNRARILCESAISPEDIDIEKERLAMQEAELEMRKMQSYEDYMVSKLAFAKAINRLKVKQYSAIYTEQ